MIDRTFIGYEQPPHRVTVDCNQLIFFAKATGETNPIYFDDAAAKAAGHHAILMPPTFGFSLFNMRADPNALLDLLGVETAKLLHGEQGFEYLAPIYAGDVITFHARVSDIYAKKNGALEFLAINAEALNQEAQTCLRLKILYIVRHAR